MGGPSSLGASSSETRGPVQSQAFHGGPPSSLPQWIAACVWRLLAPPCRVSEVVLLSCEAASALGGPCEQPEGSGCGVPTRHMQASELYLRWEQLEHRAREEEEKLGGLLGAPRLPSSAEEEAQAAAGALLAAYGCPYGVVCGSASKEGLQGEIAACTWKHLGLALCDCALRGLHAATLQCIERRCSDISKGGPSLPPLSPLCPGPSRLLLTITAEPQTSHAAAERRLIALNDMLLQLQPAAAAAATAARATPATAATATATAIATAIATAAAQDLCTAGASCLLEELRVSRLPLLLHPKAAEVWALRRQQLRCCMRLLLHQPFQQQELQKTAETSTPATPRQTHLTRAAAALQRECSELYRHLNQADGAQLTLTQSALRPEQHQQQQLLLLMLKSELSLASWHLTARSHSYQAAEHAHRVVQLFLKDLRAAPAGTSRNSSSSSSSSIGSPSLEGERTNAQQQAQHQQKQQQQQQRTQQQQRNQQQQQLADWRLDLLAAVEAEERLFWERLCQTTPSHFAGGQQLLRLLSLDLQRLLQQRLAAGLPVHARWIAACVQPGGAAAAPAAQTAEVGRRVLSLFPACEAAWRLCTYAFVALFDWTAAAAAAATTAAEAATTAAEAGAAAADLQEEALQAVVVPVLAALVRAEKQWATGVTTGPLAQRHVDTLKDELQLMQVQLTALAGSTG
ncbi:hypothetical protein ACSSS7_007211 [Eimeria intestinalis]